MTKVDQIRELSAQGKSNRQIAIAIYGADCAIRTKMAYVRIVLNQRNAGPSKADRAYRKTDKGRAINSASQLRRRKFLRANVPQWHDKEKAYRRGWYAIHRERLRELRRLKKTPEFLASERERDRIRRAALRNRLQTPGTHVPT